MKTYLHILLAALTLGLTSCLDEHGAPELTDFSETKMFAPSVSGEEYTIKQLKDEFGPGYMNSSNQMTCIDRDIVVSGVVVANDGINGNLYQTVVLRQILSDGTDQSIQLGIATGVAAGIVKMQGIHIAISEELAVFLEVIQPAADVHETGF